MKFLFAVGADFGPARQAQEIRQQRPAAARLPSPGIVIDAVPLEVSEEIRPNRNFRTSSRSARFQRPAVALESPHVRRPGGVIALRQGRHPNAYSAAGVAAFLVPPGYDAGLKSTLPALLDVLV